jgi:hypothetical protein
MTAKPALSDEQVAEIARACVRPHAMILRIGTHHYSPQIHEPGAALVRAQF